MVCDGMRVTIKFRDGRWAIADEETLRAETALLAEFGAVTYALERALTVCSALNAGVDLPANRLNRRLATLEAAYPWDFRRVPREDWPPLARLCAAVPVTGAWEWLLWMLPKRLEPHLGLEAGAAPELWAAPGWFAMKAPNSFRWEFDDSFADELHPEFWPQLKRHSDDRMVQLSVAVDPGADPAELATLAACSLHSEIHDLVALNPSTPLSILEEIVNDWDGQPMWQEATCLRAIQNPAITRPLLAAAVEHAIETKQRRRRRNHGEAPEDRTPLAYDWYDIVAWAAVSPRAPRALFETAASELVRSGQSRLGVLRSIVRHPSCTDKILERLACADDSGKRAVAAAAPTASADLIEHLSSDSIVRVRAAAASSPAVPLDVLSRLVTDRAASVRVLAQGRLAALQNREELSCGAEGPK